MVAVEFVEKQPSITKEACQHGWLRRIMTTLAFSVALLVGASVAYVAGFPHRASVIATPPTYPPPVPVLAPAPSQTTPQTIRPSFVLDVGHVNGKSPLIALAVLARLDIGNLLRLDESLSGVRGISRVVIFHNGGLYANATVDGVGFIPNGALATATYVTLDDKRWNRFPPGFDQVNGKENPFEKRGSKFGYNHMIRFWTTDVFEEPVLSDADFIMRSDSDSCFRSVDVAALVQESAGIVYVPNRRNTDKGPHVKELWESVKRYCVSNVIVPRNPEMWAELEETLPKIRGFYNNFEITKLAFFRQPEVAAFQNAMANDPPYGIYTHRWGDALLRFITVALFSTPDQLAMPISPEVYSHRCSFERET